MDANTQSSQGDSEAVKKLEQDLQNLSQQDVTAQQQPVAEVQSVQQSPQVPVASPMQVPQTSAAIPPQVDTSGQGNQQESQKKSFPLMIIAMILAIIAVLAVLAYIFGTKLLVTRPTQTPVPIASATPSPSPTPDITANWKTYTDPKAEFSFRYPIDWTKSTDVGLFNDPTNSYIFGVKVDQTSLSVNKWMTDECLVSGINFCSDPVQGPITGSIQYNWPKSQYDSIDTLVTQGNLIFDISLASRNPNQSADQITKQIYNQVLSTFVFVVSTPSGSPTINPTSSPSATPNKY